MQSFLLTEDDSFCAPIVFDLKTKVAQKEEKFKTQKDSMFDSKFFGPEKIFEDFVDLIRSSLKSKNNQNRFFVGLVQATMSGKTRLILEASMKHPIVLISFKKGNDTFYSSLLQSLSIHQTEPCSNFEQRQFHNRVIMIKVKLFILAYLEFTSLYQRHIVNSKLNWESVDRMKKIILFALLMNGGNALVSTIFMKHIDDLKVTKDNVAELSKVIDNDFQLITKALGSPWLAFDECHVPQVYCHGFLFHSNYKNFAKVIGSFIIL